VRLCIAAGTTNLRLWIMFRPIRRRGAPSCPWPCFAVSIAAAVILTCQAPPAACQTPAIDEPSIVLAPSLRVTDLGWDDNVFRVSKIDRPIGDFTSTVSPSLRGSIRLSRLQVTGRSNVDFIYFHKVSAIRSIDTDNATQFSLLLGRWTPYVQVVWTNARHRRNFEIDLPVRRVDSMVASGIDLNLSGKTSVGVVVQRSRVEYKGQTVYLGSDLEQLLGATATIQGMRFRYALTPLTAVGADIERDLNDFALAPERNSRGFRVMSVVSFKPFALVTGSAQVGVRKRSFTASDEAQFTGVVSRFDLAYTLLGRTRFTVSGQRDLSYSFRADQRDYLQAGVDLSVNQRIGNAWDVGGSVGRYRLDYGLSDALHASLAERVMTYAVDVGYRIERTRIGFSVTRQTRTSDFSRGRDYEGMRIASSVTQGF
jgi:putative beta-barrel porin BBP2